MRLNHNTLGVIEFSNELSAIIYTSVLMSVTTLINRVLSFLIAVTIVIVAGISQGWVNGALCSVIFLLIPLVLIWFPEQIGEFTGPMLRGGYVDQPSHPAVIASIGWVFLAAVPILIWYMSRE